MQLLATIEDVQSVIKCLPNEEERIKLMPYMDGKRPLSDLVPAEQLMLELAIMNRAESRLHSFSCTFTLTEDLDEVTTVLENRHTAVEQVRTFPSDWFPHAYIGCPWLLARDLLGICDCDATVELLFASCIWNYPNSCTVQHCQ